MNVYFMAVITLLGGLGGFLVGVKLLSENMEKLANNGLKALFNKNSKNPFIGVGVGTASTAIVQSSGITTVMVVGLVNAGIISLYQAATVIMGANIGTTVTAILVAFGSVDYAKIIMAFTAVGILINMFAKKDKLKTLGLAIGGLGLVFLGLSLMSSSMNDFKTNEAVINFLSKISNPFLLLLIGALSTALVQSSSATTSIIITMAGSGLFLGGNPESNAVLFFILGTNIGSCVTALMSSIGASANAKRASVIHLLFNVFGAMIFFIVLYFWKDFMSMTFARWFEVPSFQIAMFHLFFNVLCVCMFLPFTSLLVKLSTVIIKDKNAIAVPESLMDERLLKTPPIAIAQTCREAVRMAAFSMESLTVAFNAFLEKDIKAKERVFNIIKTVSDINKKLTKFLVEVSACDLTFSDEKLVSSLHYVATDIVRLSEIADNITKYTDHYVYDELVFSDDVLLDLKAMYQNITLLYEETLKAFGNRDKFALSNVDRIEEEIDTSRKDLIANHIKRLNEGKCQPQSSSVFINLVGNLERAADHLTYVAHSIDSL